MSAAYIITILAVGAIGLYGLYMSAKKNDEKMKRIKIRVNDHPHRRR